MQKKHRYWLVKYYMIFWLYKNNKKELIFNLKDENYFISRELNNIKYSEINDLDYRRIFINSILKSNETLTSLQGLYLDFFNIIFENNNKYDRLEFNEYVKSILLNDRTDYINHILKNELLIDNSKVFFNASIWNDEKAYNELRNGFTIFYEFKELDSSKSLLNLNLFNELIFDRICIVLGIDRPCKEYGANLNSGCIQNQLPITNQYFALINDKRNQKSDAHVYDKLGNIRIKIDANGLKKLIEYEVKALEEICSYNFDSK